ncbi:VOC family protein [Burkholderia sp. MR1-5-21]
MDSALFRCAGRRSDAGMCNRDPRRHEGLDSARAHNSRSMIALPTPAPFRSMQAKLRIARPVSDLAHTERMYCDAFGLTVLARFSDHDGFAGIVLGHEGKDYHFEFTHCRTHPIAPATTPEDLVVFYLPDHEMWEDACARATAHGFVRVTSFNPYWEASGRTFTDADGYRIVLQNAAWSR